MENEYIAPAPVPETFRIVGDPPPLFEALAKAQGQFLVAKKTASNPHFKSKFAPLEEIIAATKDGLSANGLAMTHLVSGGGGDYVFSTLLTHSSGAMVVTETSFTAKGIHEFGSAVTYLKRYTRAAILAVATDDDDDGNAANEQPQERKRPQATPPAPSKAKQERLQDARAVLKEAEQAAGAPSKATVDTSGVEDDSGAHPDAPLRGGGTTVQRINAGFAKLGIDTNTDKDAMKAYVLEKVGFDMNKSRMTYGIARSVLEHLEATP